MVRSSAAPYLLATSIGRLKAQQVKDRLPAHQIGRQPLGALLARRRLDLEPKLGQQFGGFPRIDRGAQLTFPSCRYIPRQADRPEKSIPVLQFQGRVAQFDDRGNVRRDLGTLASRTDEYAQPATAVMLEERRQAAGAGRDSS